MHRLRLLLVTLFVLLVSAGFSLAGESTPLSADKDLLAPRQSYDIERFEPEIKAYEQADKVSMPSGDITLFVGSSTFRKWSDLEHQFRDVHAVNRSFGGATIDEINHYASRIVLKYKPARIVFYAGTNDIAAGDSGREVYDEFVQFVETVHKALPDTRIYFISTSPGPSRLALLEQYQEANRLVSDYAKKTGACRFVDIRPVMQDERGKLKTQYFVADNLHMNKDGYDAWEPVIRAALQKP